jgi:hypothetical protein
MLFLKTGGAETSGVTPPFEVARTIALPFDGICQRTNKELRTVSASVRRFGRKAEHDPKIQGACELDGVTKGHRRRPSRYRGMDANQLNSLRGQ